MNYAFSNNKGFTLTELGVVLAIITIISSMASPNLSSLWSNLRLNTAARDMVSNFQRAKMEAVKKSVLCTITFDLTVGADTYDYVVYVDNDQDLEYDSGETILTSVKFSDYKSGVDLDLTQGGGDGLSFPNNDNSRPSIAFNSRGLAINNSFGLGMGAVWLTNNCDTQKQIIVNTTGMIKIN